jgi:hypothetical protein
MSSWTPPSGAPGDYDLTLFYTDRRTTGAGPYFSVDTTNVTVNSGAPEPASWAMMLVGFGGLGRGDARTPPVRGRNRLIPRLGQDSKAARLAAFMARRRYFGSGGGSANRQPRAQST